MTEKLLRFDEPTYYAVIFTSLRTDVNDDYSETNDFLFKAAENISGFLGQEAVRNGLGIAVSYWKNLESIEQWRNNFQHQAAKARGRKEWYKAYSIRICKVERQNYFEK